MNLFLKKKHNTNEPNKRTNTWGTVQTNATREKFKQPNLSKMHLHMSYNNQTKENTTVSSYTRTRARVFHVSAGTAQPASPHRTASTLRGVSETHTHINRPTPTQTHTSIDSISTPTVASHPLMRMCHLLWHPEQIAGGRTRVFNSGSSEWL